MFRKWWIVILLLTLAGASGCAGPTQPPAQTLPKTGVETSPAPPATPLASTSTDTATVAATMPVTTSTVTATLTPTATAAHTATATITETPVPTADLTFDISELLRASISPLWYSCSTLPSSAAEPTVVLLSMPLGSPMKQFGIICLLGFQPGEDVTVRLIEPDGSTAAKVVYPAEASLLIHRMAVFPSNTIRGCRTRRVNGRYGQRQAAAARRAASALACARR